MPLYEYVCKDCDPDYIWEAVHKVDVRMEEYCNVCSKKAEILISTASRPITYEYYSEQLGAQITGPNQKRRLAKSKGLEEY